MKSITRLRAIGAAATMAVLATLAVGNAATAAPPYETDATLTSVEFTESVVASSTEAKLSGTWSLPDNAATPAGFVVNLPEGLQGLTDDFPLLDSADVAMGDCIVTETQIICDLDSDYLAANPLNVSGTFFFWVKVTTSVTENTETTYDFGDAQTTVTVAPHPDMCTENCEWDGEETIKWGEYNRDDNTIKWYVRVASDADGATAGQQMSVEDVLGPNQEFITEYDGQTYPVLTHSNTFDEFEGWEVPGPMANVPEDQYTVDGSTVSWTAQGGYFYTVIYMAQVTDAGASVTYTNDAHSTVDGNQETATAEAHRQGGGGTGEGDNVGTFSITKDVVWNSEPIDGLTFEGSYSVTAPDGAITEGDFTVADGATWTSAEFETGSTVHLEEFIPANPENLDWETPVFSENDFAIVGASNVAVSLTNEASVAVSGFFAHKVLEGDGADLAADQTFYLDYTYEAGAGFEAGSGTLELPGDGTMVSSPALPVGAVLTLSERAPEGVDSATWESSELSTTTVTITRAEVIPIITVTNNITVSEEEPREEGELAVTGGAAPLTALAVALLLLAGGAVALRRRVA
ncbi:DUF5979 domain-containing protein [Microbacterium sp.]|uniref:DUF5979 domain-containing protein n=1 Tax=Microbacterium sp. TaxID=51671 RepID=UPI002629324C|nr:DUF5979 domain-containing protein [Microbacterium sp.]